MTSETIALILFVRSWSLNSLDFPINIDSGWFQEVCCTYLRTKNGVIGREEWEDEVGVDIKY